MLRALAPLLLEEGYVLRVFDLIDPQQSDAFNPFSYIRDAKDVMKLVNNLIQNTTPKNAQQSDPFWERSEVALDTALMLYLLYEAPPEEQNFEMLIFEVIFSRYLYLYSNSKRPLNRSAYLCDSELTVSVLMPLHQCFILTTTEKTASGLQTHTAEEKTLLPLISCRSSTRLYICSTPRL